MTKRKQAPSHGGKREGAGRKPAAAAPRDQRVTVRLTEDELERVKALAADRDLTLPDWVRTRALTER